MAKAAKSRGQLVVTPDSTDWSMEIQKSLAQPLIEDDLALKTMLEPYTKEFLVRKLIAELKQTTFTIN